tara:strand:+ start:3662 stop:4426 length:765 start_codon:yes stop_codon:yes gene_type:complete
MATERLYAPRIRIHDVLERERACTVDLPIYRDNALVGPTGAHFKLSDPSGNDVIALTAVSIIANVATYSISAPELPKTLSLGEGYMQHWRLTISGQTYEFKKPTSLARSALYPVISDLDLEAEYSDLASIRPTSIGSSYQQYIDEAWIQLVQRIRDLGNLEYLIMSPQSLRAAHKNLTFYLIFKDMDSSGLGEGRYLDLAKEHRRQHEFDFKRLTFKYDMNQDGVTDDPNSARSALGVFYTSAPPRVFSRRGRW